MNSILEAVGNVPLIRLKKLSSGNVFAKAEFLNPGGSIKDRGARHIIESAQRDGALRPGMIIIEATSGNTGIGLTLVGVQHGYQVICVMPENVSEERKKIIQAFGGQTIFTPAEESLSGCLKRLHEIAQAEPGKYFVVNQFANPRNPKGRCIATGIFLALNRAAVFWGAASWRQYQSLRANEPLAWYGMKNLKARGIQELHFGGECEQYKEKLSFYEVPLHRLMKAKYAVLDRLLDLATHRRVPTTEIGC